MLTMPVQAMILLLPVNAVNEAAYITDRRMGAHIDGGAGSDAPVDGDALHHGRIAWALRDRQRVGGVASGALAQQTVACQHSSVVR